MKNIINLIVKDEDKVQRVDVFIKNKEDSLSRTRIKNLILKKKLTLNNVVLEDPSKKVTPGDILKLEIPEPIKTTLNPYNYKLDIIYEDDDLLVINKSAGISMHPGAGNYDNTIVNALMNYCGGNLSTIGDELRPGIVHRIDKETSGLLIIARTYKSSVYLSKKFKDKNIEKFYLAILNGIPKKTNGIIISKIKDKKNKDAVTKYIVLKKIKKRFSFVLLKPETGRKRQIREHCFVLGCPILGDKKYFKKLEQNKNIDSNKLFLHAYKLKIIKKDGIKEEFTASLPDHIRKFCYLYKIPINETFINKFVISNILKGAKELKN